MKQFMSRLILVFGATFFINQAVFAHGGVSIEADKCVLKIGAYLMHFTGYQPESSGGEEFCEDIPNTGHAIIVMDFVDPQLRKMDTEFLIVQTDSWSEAQAYKVGDEAIEIVRTPAKKYKGGSITFDHNFFEPGYFVGVVTAKGTKEIVSIFPFSVGYGIGAFSGAGGSRNLLLVAIAAIVIGGGAFYYLYSARRKPKVAPDAA